LKVDSLESDIKRELEHFDNSGEPAGAPDPMEEKLSSSRISEVPQISKGELTKHFEKTASN